MAEIPKLDDMKTDSALAPLSWDETVISVGDFDALDLGNRILANRIGHKMSREMKGRWVNWTSSSKVQRAIQGGFKPITRDMVELVAPEYATTFEYSPDGHVRLGDVEFWVRPEELAKRHRQILNDLIERQRRSVYKKHQEVLERSIEDEGQAEGIPTARALTVARAIDVEIEQKEVSADDLREQTERLRRARRGAT
jgi:hypothetical protein